jgi:hypothetical protein
VNERKNEKDSNDVHQLKIKDTRPGHEVDSNIPSKNRSAKTLLALLQAYVARVMEPQIISQAGRKMEGRILV